jgi:integrase
MLDQQGLSARTIADQLGHARSSMTQDVYMGRRVVNQAAALALEETGSRDSARTAGGSTAPALPGVQAYN